MRRLVFFLLLLCFSLGLTGCPKKGAPGDPDSSAEPIEGSSAPANDKGTEAPADEMQEKKGGDPAAAEPAAEPAPDEKK